jgi:hypothetical protein
MRRREFIAIIAGAAVWPFPARARQRGVIAKIGFLFPGPETMAKPRSVQLLAGLASEGLREPDQIALLIRATGGDAALIAPVLNELSATIQTKAVAAAAQLVNVKTEVLEFKSPFEFEAVFDAASARRPDGLLLLSSPLVSVYSKQLAELALKHRLPAISLFSSFARAGGLISYGPDLDEVFREAGVMAAKVLKGTKAADLPAERPTRFELVVNLKTAKVSDGCRILLSARRRSD